MILSDINNIWLHKLSHTTSFHFLHNTQDLDYIINATDYWPLAREYLIWNATVAALQFWTTDLEVHVLSSTIEQVYYDFLLHYIHAHLLCTSNLKTFHLVAP